MPLKSDPLEVFPRATVSSTISVIEKWPNGRFSKGKYVPKGALAADTQWTELLDWAIFSFEPLLRWVDIFSAICGTQYHNVIPSRTSKSILGMFHSASNTCYSPVGKLEFSLLDMNMVTSLPILSSAYEEYVSTEPISGPCWLTTLPLDKWCSSSSTITPTWRKIGRISECPSKLGRKQHLMVSIGNWVRIVTLSVLVPWGHWKIFSRGILLCALNWLILLQSGFVGLCFSEEEETLFVRGLFMQLTAWHWAGLWRFVRPWWRNYTMVFDEPSQISLVDFLPTSDT